MRLIFKITPNKELVPFDYQDLLISVFHKWMGWNEIHDEISLYSLSWLQNGKKSDKGFNFINGAIWFISFWDETFSRTLIKNSMKSPEILCGMMVDEINILETPLFTNMERFFSSSPIFIRKYDSENRAIHLTVNDEDVDFYLTETLKKKLKIARLDYDIKVRFDKEYPNPKTKLVKINGIDCRANFCPVIIEGDPEAIKFAWNVGIGHLTGCGFGAIY